MSAGVVAQRPFRPSSSRKSKSPPVEAKILFQQFFKSVGPRTYAAQVKEAGNGNHFVVLTESKRSDGDAEPRKTRLFVFSEDFVEFFKLLSATAQFIKANPVSDEVKSRQRKYWAKKANAPTRASDGDRNGPRPQREREASRPRP